jgi:DNA-directed RNA polymerase sigma subunit (sigma70/sigma32)
MSESDRTNGIESVLKNTFEELSQRFSLTEEQIREIESTALRKLRRPSCLLPKQAKFRANAFALDQSSQM